MAGRYYDISHLGNAARAADKTALQITAGAGLPVEVMNTHMVAADNATSWQMTGQWQLITTVNGGSGNQGTTKVTPVDSADTEGLTVKGDLSAEPTAYDANVIREASTSPSVVGYRQGIEKDAQPVLIEAGDSWGLFVSHPTGAFANTIIRVKCLVRERTS